MAPATVQQTAAAKGESEDFGNFSYETQTEGLFVAFAIKIPNAFTDFDLWADERKATPSPGCRSQRAFACSVSAQLGRFNSRITANTDPAGMLSCAAIFRPDKPRRLNFDTAARWW